MMALNTGGESNRDKLIRGSAQDVYDSGALNEELLDKILDNLVLESGSLFKTVWDSFQEMYRMSRRCSVKRTDARRKQSSSSSSSANSTVKS